MKLEEMLMTMPTMEPMTMMTRPTVEEVLVEHEGFLVLQAMRWAGTSPGVALEDLLQEGRLGLLEAWERFDAERGVKFLTYASHWVYQRMGRWVKNTGTTVRVPQYRAGKVAQFYASLDEPVNAGDGEHGTRLHELLAAPEGEVMLSGDAGMMALLETEMARLTERERFVMVERFWKERTLDDVGRELGVTREWVRQIERQVLGILRGRLRRMGEG